MSDAYEHRFHVGNVGDVWKHVALLSWLDVLGRDPAPIHLLDTHAGAGRYALGHTGEWTAGVGRVRGEHPAIRRYREAVGATPGAWYPGSPSLLAARKRAQDTLVACEADPGAHAQLAREIGGAAVLGDGWTKLTDVPKRGRALVHIDPPFVTREDWEKSAEAIRFIAKERPDACLILWYPIKSLTRPNALHAAVRDVRTTAIDLIVTPLDKKRNALNGSGILVVRPPAHALSAVLGAAPELGASLATHDGWWQLRTTGQG